MATRPCSQPGGSRTTSTPRTSSVRFPEMPVRSSSSAVIRAGGDDMSGTYAGSAGMAIENLPSDLQPTTNSPVIPPAAPPPGGSGSPGGPAPGSRATPPRRWSPPPARRPAGPEGAPPTTRSPSPTGDRRRGPTRDPRPAAAPRARPDAPRRAEPKDRRAEDDLAPPLPMDPPPHRVHVVDREVRVD